MPQLTQQRIILPGVVERAYRHTDGAGGKQMTFEVVQDAAPIIKSIRAEAEASKRGDFRLMSRIPMVELQDVAKNAAQVWGIRTHKAFSEIMNGKTDRAQAVLKTFSQGRDYRKLQTRNYV